MDEPKVGNAVRERLHCTESPNIRALRFSEEARVVSLEEGNRFEVADGLPGQHGKSVGGVAVRFSSRCGFQSVGTVNKS